MGLVIRQSFYTTIISYAGVVIGYLNLLYLYPKFLSLEQVGLFRTLQDAAILLSPFAQFGLTQSIIKFYPHFVKSKKHSHSFITLMLLLALGGFALFFVVFKLFEAPLLSYFEDNAREIIQYSTLILWLTLLMVMIAVLDAYARSLFKTVFSNFIREVINRIFLSVLVLLYFSEVLNFDQFIIGSVLTYLICLILLGSYLWQQGDFLIHTDFRSLPKEKFPELIQYSLLSFAGMAGMILIGKIDSMMVSAMLGLAANAIYTTAFYMATVIEIPKRALSQITMPLFSKAFEQNEVTEVSTLYKKASINQFIIGSLLLIGVWINIDNIFNLMPKGDHYEPGKWVVLIVGLGKLMDMLFGPSSEIIVLSRYYYFNIILIILLAVIVIISNNLLIPRFGIEGAAWGSAIALISYNLVKYIFIYLKLHIQPFEWATGKVLLIGVFTILINLMLVKQENIFADIIYRSSIITILFSTLILWSKSSPDANGIVKNLINLIGRRK